MQSQAQCGSYWPLRAHSPSVVLIHRRMRPSSPGLQGQRCHVVFYVWRPTSVCRRSRRCATHRHADKSGLHQLVLYWLQNAHIRNQTGCNFAYHTGWPKAMGWCQNRTVMALNVIAAAALRNSISSQGMQSSVAEVQAACLQIILLEDVEKLGTQGQLLSVPVGYWRNYLQPNNIAKVASERILE